jgi:hypothetical protein
MKLRVRYTTKRVSMVITEKVYLSSESYPSIAIDERHAGLFRACISDLLLYASPFDDVDTV